MFEPFDTAATVSVIDQSYKIRDLNERLNNVQKRYAHGCILVNVQWKGKASDDSIFSSLCLYTISTIQLTLRYTVCGSKE